MRKFYLAAVVCMSTMTALAQGNINMGDWMMGGSISFVSQKYGDVDNSQNTTFQLAPNIGYFFINNLTGGVRLSFTSYKPKDTDAETEFVAGPFLRFYFLPSTQKVNVFLDGQYGFGSAKYNTISGTGTIKTTESFNQFGGSAGVAVFLTPATALEFAFNYSSLGGDYYNPNPNVEDKRLNNFGGTIGFQIHLPGSGVKK